MFGKHVEFSDKDVAIRVWVPCVPGTPDIELYQRASERLREAVSRKSFKARVIGREEEN